MFRHVVPGLLAMATVAAGSLCYDPGSGEYAMTEDASCGAGKPYQLKKGSHAGQSEIESDSVLLCQQLCHVEKDCAGFEWQTFNIIDEMPLPVPKCLFRSAGTEETTRNVHSRCFRKLAGGAFKFCAQEGETCDCGTEVRFGRNGKWSYKPIHGTSSVTCSAALFGADEGEEGRECQCTANEGLLLLLDAENYVSGASWKDESGNGHDAYIAFPFEKPDKTSPQFVPATQEDPAHFSFDGKDDYLAVKDLKFDGTQYLSAFSVTVMFRTSYKDQSSNKNWALLDFDRSENFNIFVRGDGRIGFSTTGKDGTDDMVGTKVVNDATWHEVTVIFSKASTTKTIVVDGGVDATKQGVHSDGVGTKSLTRYGMIGEGSESSSQFGQGNGFYYHGDIARVVLYLSALSTDALGKHGSKVPVDNMEHCNSMPDNRCVWSAETPEDTYYFGGFDEETDSVAHTVGGAPTVLFPYAYFDSVPLDTKKVRAAIEEGCKVGDDLLELGWTGGSVAVSYDSTECTLTISAEGTVTASEWLKVVRSIVFSSKSPDFHERRVLWFFGEQIYSSATGHYYEFVKDKGITWQSAQTACTQRVLLGMPGYLATVTSAVENAVVHTRLHGFGWIGLTDEAKEGVWRWVTGPEGTEDGGQGRMLGTGTRQFTPHLGAFTYWKSNEPNNYGGEDYAGYYTSGYWNDFHGSNKGIAGYICEWGGMNGTDATSGAVHGTARLHLQGCVLRPCNHQTRTHCLREKGCSWSPSSAFCYPSCPLNYFTELCNVYCSASETCSGNGKCGSDGRCSCDKGWGGPACNWEKHSCTAWGDPHYTSFLGEKFDFHGVPSIPGSEKAYIVYQHGSVSVIARHYRCSGTVAKPIGCMKQIKVIAGTWTLEMNMDFEGQQPRELGIIHVTNGTQTPNKVDTFQIEATKGLPSLIGPLALVRIHKASEKRTHYFFELPDEGEVHTAIKLTQDDAWKAPYMNVYVDHYGSLEGTTGLCTGSCESDAKATSWGKDCTGPFGDKFACEDEQCVGFASDVLDQSIPFCGGKCTVDSEGCADNPVALSWAQACCDKYKICGGEENYQQCVVENCNMGWIGDEASSQCAGAFELVLQEEGACDAEICPFNRGGVGCKRCAENYFGPDCQAWCRADVTCNGHGVCSGDGTCWCDAEFKYSWTDPEEGIVQHCLHVCQAQTTQKQCKGKSACRWLAGSGMCIKACPKGTFGNNCEHSCDAKTSCNGRGSCTDEGKCACKKGWGGPSCNVGKYTCSAWGDPHYTTFSGQRYDFFGPAKDLEGNDIQYSMYAYGSLHMTARHWKCNNRATCMKQLALWDQRGGTVEVRLDGSIRVNCTLYSKQEVLEKLQYGDWIVMPRTCPEGMPECTPAAPVKIVEAGGSKLGKGAFSYYLEVSDIVEGPTGDLEKQVEFEMEVAGRSKAVDVYLTHYGQDPESDGVTGLCLGKPGSGKPGTGEAGCFLDDVSLSACKANPTKPYGHCRTGPPRCAVAPAPACWAGVSEEGCGLCDLKIGLPEPTVWRCDTPEGERQAQACCRRQKKCGNQAAYDQCYWDECALGDDGVCLDNHEASLEFDDQSAEVSCACDSPHMELDPETGKCSRCKADWYNSGKKPCSKYCNADISCSGHGTCGSGGLCWCDEGWEGEECLQVIIPPAPSTACEDKKTQDACESVTVCAWAEETGNCYRTPKHACWTQMTPDKCAGNGCYWEEASDYDLEGICLDSRPRNEVTAECGKDCPLWFTPTSSTVKLPACPIDECVPPREGEQVIANLTGYPSNKVFPPECSEAATKLVNFEEVEDEDLCGDGWVAFIDEETNCDELYAAMLPESGEMVHRAYYLDANTRVTSPFAHWDPEDESYFGYRVCYVPDRPETADAGVFVPSTTAQRACPGHFEFDLEGECTVCEEGWYGPTCSYYCNEVEHCHGHGVCKVGGTQDDRCSCEAGWEDMTDFDEQEFEYTLECFAATASAQTAPDFKPYVPEMFAAATAELRPATDDCDGDDKYEMCPPPREGGMVRVNVTGVGLASCPQGDVCPDGTAALVVKGASCSAPKRTEVLMDKIPMSTTAREGVRLSEEFMLPFAPELTEYQVCYRPKVSPSPPDVRSLVATKPPVLSAAAANSEENDDGGSSNAGLIAGLVVGGLALAGIVAGIAYKKWSSSDDADFSHTKLDTIASDGPTAEISDAIPERDEP